MIRQRHDAGAEPDVARASGRAGDEHLGTGDDLEAAGMVLADPGFVIVQPVEMLEQFHIAFERKCRVYFEILKWREENAAAQIRVVHLGPSFDDSPTEDFPMSTPRLHGVVGTF